MDDCCRVKVIDQSEPMTLCDVSEYLSIEGVITEGVSCGVENQDIGTSSDRRSSLSKYFSTHGVVQSIEHTRTEPNREIEASKVHWSELSSNCDSEGDGESNREIYERLRLLPKYQHWLDFDSDLESSDDMVLGQKLAEGGQAEIFELEFCQKKNEKTRYVLKVFKEGYSLRDLQSQWPEGILSRDIFITGLHFRGGVVLEDDRFAFLLARYHIDLRKLIDIAQEGNSPLWEEQRRSFEEFSTYKPQTRRNGRSTAMFSDECAQHIMNEIAWSMSRLHEKDVLHRDLKASNILCHHPTIGPPDQRWCILVHVADYESSIGVVGTAFWRAPEILQQLKERKPKVHFTREADVYSYAMTCYEVLTGRIPFEAYKTSDYDDVLNGMRPTLPDHVPTWVKDLIHRCWHQNPSERPTFKAVVEEMKSHGIDRGGGLYLVTLEGPDKS